jgi:hypothetical protein
MALVFQVAQVHSLVKALSAGRLPVIVMRNARDGCAVLVLAARRALVVSADLVLPVWALAERPH